MKHKYKTYYSKQIADLRTMRLRRSKHRAYAHQIRQRGFCNADLWSLDVHLAQLILPRLREYLKLDDRWPLDVSRGGPLTAREREIMNHMREDVMFALQICADGYDITYGAPCGPETSKEQRERIRRIERRTARGLSILAKYFTHLWL